MSRPTTFSSCHAVAWRGAALWLVLTSQVDAQGTAAETAAAADPTVVPDTAARAEVPAPTATPAPAAADRAHRADRADRADAPAAVAMPTPAIPAPAAIGAPDGAPDPGQPVKTEGRAPHMTASFVDGLRMRSADGALGAQLQFATWTRAVAQSAPSGPAQAYFEVPLVRPLLQFDAMHDRLRITAQPELAGAQPHLLDLMVDWHASKAFALRLGQFRTPYSRAYITPIVQLTMSDRGIVSDHFRADRDTGLMASGHLGDHIEYNLAVLNGARINDRAGDARRPMGIARLVLTPYGSVPYDQSPGASASDAHGMAIGIAGLTRERAPLDADGNAVRERTYGGSGELAIVEGPAAFFAEGYLHDDQRMGVHVKSAGVFAQAAVFIVPQLLELSARGSFVDPDVDTSGGLVRAYEAGIEGYMQLDGTSFGHHASLALQHRYIDSDVDLGAIPRGHTHRFVAQLQLWI